MVIPCRAGSSRVREKNTRPFGPKGESLLEIKLRQVLQLDFVDEIILSTNDPLCVAVAREVSESRVTVDRRPEELCRDSTNLSDLILYFGSIVTGHHFLWTHVTSPFFGSDAYARAYESFLNEKDKGKDSLVVVEKIQDFCMFREQPINFGHPGLFWPRTQDLEPIYRLTSGLFVGGTAELLAKGNRVGSQPFYFEVNGPESIDIDWSFQFDLARTVLERHPNLAS